MEMNTVSGGTSLLSVTKAQYIKYFACITLNQLLKCFKKTRFVPCPTKYRNCEHFQNQTDSSSESTGSDGDNFTETCYDFAGHNIF